MSPDDPVRSPGWRGRAPTKKESLTVTDNRTGKSYELPDRRTARIRAMDLRQIKTGAGRLRR